MTTDSGNAAGTDATRQRLIEAAFKLFSETGYTRATTRAIAAEAGVNEVTLFRHFGNKKGLLMACVEAFNEAGFAATFEQHLTGDYAGDIAAMVRLQMADTLNGFEVLRLMMCDASEMPEIQEGLLAGARQNQALVAAYFRRQIERGVVRPDLDPDVLTHAFDSLTSSYILFQSMLKASFMPQVPPETVVRQLADIFVQGTINQQT